MAKTITVTPAEPGSTDTPPATLADAIAENAISGITSSAGDGQSVQVDIDKQIRAADWMAAKRAAVNPFAALKRARIVPPGAI